MRTRLMRFVVLVVLGITAIIPHSKAVATGEFQADYDVQYAVAPSGKTIVTQHVTLTNKLTNFYPEEYSLLLDSDKISNIIAYDECSDKNSKPCKGGVITPVISVKDGKTKIGLKFNVKSVGLGNTLTFSLRYEHEGVANRAGSIWEIYIPGVVNDPDIGMYNVTLSVPPTFGPAAYLSPLPSSGNTWSKDQMIRGGIAGAYGKSQRFDVDLSYTLQNTRQIPSVQEIALPPDTAYQEVALVSLNPKPETVTRDTDGNWIATYTVPAKQTVAVKAVLTISTYLSPRPNFTTVAPEQGALIAPQEYWETEDPRIQALASTYNTPRAIYSYVASQLSYDYGKVNAQATRLGAVGALNAPKAAVCMEYTDLFIAIARAAGIPARRIIGYAYTNNPKLRPLSYVSDILHAWPEYYDREANIWIPVDPTWSSTTGGVDYFSKVDFNHITFAINGSNSSIPYSAGYYRNPGSSSRDVLVEFSDAETKARGADVIASIEFPSQVAAGTGQQGTLVVTNRGSETAYAVSVSLITEPGNIHIDKVISELLPYATDRIPFRPKFSQTFQAEHGKITAQVNDTIVTKTFRIQPLYWLIAIGALVVSIVIGVTAWFVHRTIWNRSHR